MLMDFSFFPLWLNKDMQYILHIDKFMFIKKDFQICRGDAEQQILNLFTEQVN